MKFGKSAVRSALGAMVCGCVLLGLSGCKHKRKAKSPANTTDYAANVQQLDKVSTLPGMRWRDYSDDLGNVQKFYGDRDNELAWTRDGKPTGAAMELLQLFQDAATKGLNPEDYDADAAGQGRWVGRLKQLAEIAKKKDSSDAAADAVAQFDVAMTISAMRYFEDLHVGRVNPQALNFDIDTPLKRSQFDVATLLNDQVVDEGNIAEVAAGVEPTNPMYKATEQALAAYRVLAMKQGAAAALPALAAGAKPVGVGGAYAAVPQLWARLQVEGDAAVDVAGVPQRYDAEVAAAVKHYQVRNGLQDDGRLGQGTIDSLNVPMTVRVQELVDSLERWRWLPDNYMQPRVLANLPEFMLRAYEADHTLAFKMKVIDGEAKGNHDTPMFVRLMRYVVFRPYWNLPPSIIKKEIVPHLEKSGLGYLAANGYEAYKNDGTVVTSFTVHDIEHLKYNVRQLPGPKNSLGLVKFLFPNSYDVYMHSTPELYLFGLYRRDRSHGCVRLQHADQMALWVLHGDQSDPDAENGWDADKIDVAMTGELNNRTINLKTPLPVVIAYFTAMPDEDGTTHFFNDIYGYDKDLNAALAKGRPYERAEVKVNPKLVPGETE
jgi:murein L,D-transpeptidase YcbB/YkuD